MMAMKIFLVTRELRLLKKHPYDLIVAQNDQSAVDPVKQKLMEGGDAAHREGLNRRLRKVMTGFLR